MRYFILLFVLVLSMAQGISLNAGIALADPQTKVKDFKQNKSLPSISIKKKKRFEKKIRKLQYGEKKIFGLLSMIIGICSILVLGITFVLGLANSPLWLVSLILSFILGLAGLGFGIFSLIKKEDKRGLGVVGIITGGFVTILLLILTFSVLLNSV